MSHWFSFCDSLSYLLLKPTYYRTFLFKKVFKKLESWKFDDENDIKLQWDLREKLRTIKNDYMIIHYVAPNPWFSTPMKVLENRLHSKTVYKAFKESPLFHSSALLYPIFNKYLEAHRKSDCFPSKIFYSLLICDIK